MFENIYIKSFDYFCTKECPCWFKSLVNDPWFVVDLENGYNSIAQCENSVKSLYAALNAEELYTGTGNLLQFKVWFSSKIGWELEDENLAEFLGLIAQLGYLEESSECSGMCSPLKTTVFALESDLEPEITCKEVI